jgi:hypothetical protein
MFEETREPWASVHGRMMEFFNAAMAHVAAAGRNRHSVEWQRAAAMLSFPEPSEFCLGYGEKTIFGSGSGQGLGEAMLDAAQESIDLGMVNITDFGELLLFGEHFGADRVGDMVCNIVKDDFIRYTERVVKRHGIATEMVTVDHQGFDHAHHRWVRRRVALPINPCWTSKTPVLVVPERFLSELPDMEDGAFWDWVYANENEQLRKDLGYEVTLNLSKHDIIELARRRVRLRRKYGVRYAAARRANPSAPYDVTRDPAFRVKPFAAAEAVATSAQIQQPADPAEFCTFVKHLATEFKAAVEDRGIWKSFWDGDRAFYEDQAQRLFHLAVLQTCKLHDVDVSPETDAGQGPVDFKFSAGWRRKALVEFKFANSSHFWDNLEQQTPTYRQAEQVECGYIVVIQHSDQHCTKDFIDRVTRIVDQVTAARGWTYEAVFVDVRPRPSASKLKRNKT